MIALYLVARLIFVNVLAFGPLFGSLVARCLLALVVNACRKEP